MERLEITPEQQTIMDDYAAQQTPLPSTDPVHADTNLVVGDDLEIDNSWKVRVIGGDGATGTHCIVPEWGNYCANIVLSDYITDRAGPNGETMPIRDEQQMQAMLAKQGGNPKHAKQDKRDRLREFLALQSADTARAIRKFLKLDKDG
jgi:hypothetical protein